MENIQIAVKPVVSIIVPVYNQCRYTAQLFASLARVMVGVPYEIIVIDNGSRDETLSFVGSHTPGQLRGHSQGDCPPLFVKLLHNTVPRTLSRSWNMGCDAAEGQYLLITNNDVIYTPGSVQAMVKALRGEWQYGVALPSNRQTTHGVLPLINTLYDSETYVGKIAANLKAVEEFGAGRAKSGVLHPVPEPYIPQGGYCFMTTPRVRWRVGPFDEAYELTGEDYDWFSRNRRHFKMVLVEDAYVEHFEHQSVGLLGDEYNERLCHSRFLLTEKREGMAEMFSIVMPNYNRVDTVRAAIDSVLAQTFEHWRLYIMDDGSSEWDSITRLAREYQGHRNRIWWFRSAGRQGAGTARNNGLGLTRGKYVAFLDSDDIWYPCHLEKHWQAHERGSWALVYSDPDFANRSWHQETQTFHYKVRDHPTIKYRGDYDRDRLIQHNYIQTSAVSAWGELARANRFTPEKAVGEDWDYFKAVADVDGEGRPVLHLAESTCRYHISKDPHEEDHLIKRDVPSLGIPDRPDTSRVLIPLPGMASLGVVVATMDRLSQLAVSLRSIGGLPFVVYDDGGANLSGTVALVRDFPSGGLMRTDITAGQSSARNRAVEACAFAWVQFLDDDDILTGDWLLRLTGELTDNVDVVTFSALVPGTNGLAVTGEVFTSQICVRRSKFLSVGGFDERLHLAEDKELLIRLQQHGARIRHLPLPLVIRPSRGGTGLAGAPDPRSDGRRVVASSADWNKRF